MSNDFDSAIWADNHHQLSDGVAGWFDKLAYAFERLQAIEYDAPWERTRH
jgi:hypothetical protein